MEPFRTSRDAADHDAIAIAEARAPVVVRAARVFTSLPACATLMPVSAANASVSAVRAPPFCVMALVVVIRNVPVPTLTSAASVVPPDPLTSPTLLLFGW